MKLQNEFLNLYLQYVEETESPRLFHIWSALSGIASCLGRRIYLPFGTGDIFPNIYVLLVGPPAVKKSSAMLRTRKLLTKSTSIRFAPDDTSGKHQGLLVAMAGKKDEQEEQLFEEIEKFNSSLASGLGTNGHEVLNKLSGFNLDIKDKETMYVTSEEFTSFIGTNNTEMLTFLLRMWDGSEYRYALTKSEVFLEEPLLNIVGCTTPTALAKALPTEAVGQGFMSRVILVYSYTKYKRIPWPVIDKELEQPIQDLFSILFNSFEGEFEISPEAKKYFEEQLYDKQLKFNDPRFLHYKDRRHQHLLKVAMLLAASRLSKRLERRDLEESDFILEITEAGMPDALGEYGLSPLANAKQKMTDIIKSVKGTINKEQLWAFMHRDMTIANFSLALSELSNTGVINEVQTNDGPAYMENIKKRISEDKLLAAFLSMETEGSKRGLKGEADGPTEH